MRVCYEHKEFRAQLREETLIDIARTTDGITITLDRVDANTAETKADVKEALNRIGNVESFLANLEGQSTADLRIVAAAFEEYALHEKPALIKFLTQKAEEYRRYRAQIDGLDERVAAIANLKDAAQDAAARLDFDEVETLLSRVDEVETEIATEIKEARATNALLRNRPEKAFQILSAAADSFASIDPLEPANRRLTYAIQLYDHGLRYGGPGLILTVQMNKDALSHLDISTAPDLWASAQNNLALALKGQGKRTGGAAGTELLAEAVTACCEALTVRTRDEHPVDWATTQNNLANARQEQGSRTDGAAGADLLAEAATAYRDALTVRTRDEQPVHWARTQENLAVSKLARAEHEATPDPAAHLRTALTHVEAALSVFDPEHMSARYQQATKLRDRIKARLSGDDQTRKG